MLSNYKMVGISNPKLINQNRHTQGENMKALRFDLHHLRAFKVLSQQLHFKHTADILCMTQPALSRLIKSLEEALGAVLFERSTRQVQLTVAGELFLREVDMVFKYLERSIDVVQQAGKGMIGRLKIGYNDFAIHEVLPKVIESFQSKQPNIQIEMIYMPSLKQIRALAQAEIDVGFMLSAGHELPNLCERKIKHDPSVVILHQSHPLAARASLNLKELAQEHFILGSESDWQMWRQYFFGICAQAGFQPKVVQEISSTTGIMGLVAAKMGIAILSQSLRNYIRAEVVAVDLVDIQSTFISAVNAPDNHNACLVPFLEHLDAMSPYASGVLVAS